MRRFLVVGGVVVSILAAVALVWATRPARLTANPVPVHVSDLAPAVYQRNQYRGQLVRVAYPLRLHPTADPLAWEFRPGSDTLPPTHRIHFTESPPLGGCPVVIGTVDRIEPDGIVRLNNVPGVVVIRSARVVPPTSP